eukprot:15442011-Alexandrium_andersonii.AAC.1
MDAKKRRPHVIRPPAVCNRPCGCAPATQRGSAFAQVRMMAQCGATLTLEVLGSSRARHHVHVENWCNGGDGDGS